MTNARPIEAFIALGSNLGDSLLIIRQAFSLLEELSQSAIRCSSLWRSGPVDCPLGSADFVNAVAALSPLANETPETLLAKLKHLEGDFGRLPKRIMNEPRPLDLDLIAFGSERRESPNLTIPHPRAHLRAFVLLPLAEIAPSFVLAGQSKSVGELASPFRNSSAVQRI